tara:strand:+ start:80 stop:739 length:660 start_codon:yes stop_codon:yes gene_type:complete
LIRSLLKRELLLCFFGYGTTSLGLAFFLSVIFISALGYELTIANFSILGPGIIWTTTLLAVLITAEALIKDDYRDGSLDSFFMSPIPIELILITKALAHWISVCCPIIIISPFIALIFDFSHLEILYLGLGLLLGTPAFSLIAMFGVSLTFSLKRAGILMPIISMPFYIPTLVFGLKIISSTKQDEVLALEIIILGAITLISTAIIPFASSFGLKASIR